MQKFSLEIKKFFISLTVGLVFVFSFSQFFVKSEANAAIGINRQINFQGKLVNNPAAANVANTSYTVVFTLYDNATGGSNLWQETQSVSTTDGIFRVALGSVTPFPANFNFNWSGLYLGIKVNADAEMTPRIQMAAVPFAFNAEKVAGLTVQDTSGNASTSGTLQIANAKTVSFADAFTTSGAFPLTFTTTNTTSLTLPTTGILLTNTAAANQTITSTQTSGNLLSLADSTGLTSAITGLTIGLTSSTNSQNKTGISFDLSGGTGGVYYDLLGTGSTWSITRAGALTVASCSGCGSSSGYSPFQELSGAIVPNNSTLDFLVGGQSTTSAKFSVLGIAAGTNPSASVSATSGANSGNGIVISGDGSLQSLRNNGLTLGGATTGNISISPLNGGAGSLLTVNAVTTTFNSTTTLNAASLATIDAAASLSLDSTTLTLGNGSAATIQTTTNGLTLNSGSNTLTFDATDTILSATGLTTFNSAATLAFSGDITITGNDITNTVLNLGNGAAATIGTVSDDNLTVTPQGTGDLILSSDFDSGVSVGTSANTPAPLSVSGGLGSNAAFIVNNLNSGDLIAASASGVTKFRVDNSGNLIFNQASTIQTSTGALTLDSASNTLVIAASDTTLSRTAAGTYTIDLVDAGTTKLAITNSGAGAASLQVDGLTSCDTIDTDTSGNLVCGTDSGAGTFASPFRELNASIIPLNSTVDFLVGGQATTSAKFAVLGVNTGQTIASASGNLIVMANNGWGGQIGIGTTTPGQALDVRGSGIFGNQLAYDVTAQPNRSKTIYANELTTNTTNDMFSTAGSLEVNPAGTTSRIYYGGLYNVLSTSGNAQNFTGRLVGFQGQVSHKGIGTLAQARGFAGFITNDSTGIITDAFAGRFGNTNTSTGSYTNAYGVYISSPTNSGGGTYNTNYGLYVQDQSNVGIVGSYNVWSDGFNSKNYFAGNVGISATPSARLHVAGSWGSNAAVIIDQLNSGDILAASASGTTKFVITNAGSIGLYGTNPSITNTGSNTLTINSGSTGNLQFFGTSNTLSSAGALTLAGGLSALTINGNTITNGTGTLTLAAGKTVSFADAFTTSGAFPLTLTSTAITNATIPSGTVTLVDLASSQSLTNKTIGTGGLTFNVASGNPDIITSASNQDFTITPNGTGKVVLGTATNGLTFDPAAGTTYTGTGRKTKTIHLAPEYPGAILTASGSATTTGSMTSDASPSATFQNYYEWSSTQASLQDYTVAVHVKLPADFSAWPTSNAITVEFNTATINAPQNKFDFILFNTSDASPKTPVVMRTANVSSVAKTWQTLTITGAALTSGTATLNTAGHEAVIYLKMYAGSPGYVQVGDIELNYLSAF